MAAPRIAFIGAGSFIFARRILSDLLSFPELREIDLRLMDVDAGRLDAAYADARKNVDAFAPGVAVSKTTDRRAACDGADFVVAMFEPDGLAARKLEVETCIAHGVPVAVGDTLAPSGIFKGVRTATVALALARDMAEVCPDAWLMNYVNPMAITVGAVARGTRIRTLGMCHGLAHTLARLAHHLGLPNELDTLAYGVNHLCWLTTLTHQGRDVYPDLWRRMEDPAVFDDDPVRFQMMRAFGLFPTESPYHNAEYVPYFHRRFAPRKVEPAERPGLNSAMTGWRGPVIVPGPDGPVGGVEPCIPLAWDIQLYEGEHAGKYAEFVERERHAPPVAPTLSVEYAARVIHARWTGAPRRLSLNVPNDGLLAALPADGVVEVPVYVDGAGLHPEGGASLPPACAALCRRNMEVQERVVAGVLGRDRRAIRDALLLDPLTGACLEPDAIGRLFDALVERLGERLPAWMR